MSGHRTVRELMKKRCSCPSFVKDEFDICTCGHIADQHDENDNFRCKARIEPDDGRELALV